MLKAKSLFFFFFFSLLFSSLCIATPTPSIEQKCNDMFTKLFTCLDFSTGKAEKATDSCCNSVKEIRNEEPVCLCYVIQQAHEGNKQLKSLGVQVTRLLQLPTDCKLTNSSTSDCPKVLNLSPGSPDYAFFTNSSAANSNSSAAGMASPETSSSSTNGTTMPTSYAAIQKFNIIITVGLAVAVAVAIMAFLIEV
ncbi:non-specific lipid transfer protein GPI-anchored 1-like [Tasmannia lanceolata]|uniref:non-specific lipid transfer protein GPI-anchored 1-like n=1 Tax=Tasmannia lanceolata TaxID=3420 RepID=UPI004064426E